MNLQAEPEAGVLQRLLSLLSGSLPLYLAQARPWVGHGQQRLAAAVDQMAADRRALADRVCVALQDLGQKPQCGRFPTAYSDLHYLQVDYLLRRLIEAEKANLAVLVELAQELPAESPARALVDEALGNTRGHLEVLQS